MARRFVDALLNAAQMRFQFLNLRIAVFHRAARAIAAPQRLGKLFQRGAQLLVEPLLSGNRNLQIRVDFRNMRLQSL